MLTLYDPQGLPHYYDLVDGEICKVPPPGERTDNIVPLRGSVLAQYATRNGVKYGPYWYRVWEENRKVHKVAVPLADLEKVRQACAIYRERRTSPPPSYPKVNLLTIDDYAELLNREITAIMRNPTSAHCSVELASEG
jgi:Uma2 family endonuclease